MSASRCFAAIFLTALLLHSPVTARGQSDALERALLYLAGAEKEEAAAKEVRLKFIREERTRIQSELKQFNTELDELTKIVPDPIRDRDLSPRAAVERDRERKTFDNWVNRNDPQYHAAITKGTGLNALLRVLGPIAHYRRMRSTANSTGDVLPSLAAAHAIAAAEVSHYRMVPASSAGSKVTVRLNQLPLDLQWPPVILQNWQSDCKSIQKLRDEYVVLLNSTASESLTFLEHAELLDSALALLQAKVQHKKRTMARSTSLPSDKSKQIHGDLYAALRYLETVRATAARFKNVPSDYKVHRFPGGSIEDFLDFSYTHGLAFQESLGGDEQYYFALHRRMQDYAHDVQFVEDWKSDVEQRIAELEATDKLLVWRASEQ